MVMHIRGSVSNSAKRVEKAGSMMKGTRKRKAKELKQATRVKKAVRWKRRQVRHRFFLMGRASNAPLSLLGESILAVLRATGYEKEGFLGLGCWSLLWLG